MQIFTVNNVKLNDRENQLARIPEQDSAGSKPLPPLSHKLCIEVRMRCGLRGGCGSHNREHATVCGAECQPPSFILRLRDLTSVLLTAMAPSSRARWGRLLFCAVSLVYLLQAGTARDAQTQPLRTARPWQKITIFCEQLQEVLLQSAPPLRNGLRMCACAVG